jgi:hypothetical protein
MEPDLRCSGGPIILLVFPGVASFRGGRRPAGAGPLAAGVLPGIASPRRGTLAPPARGELMGVGLRKGAGAADAGVDMVTVAGRGRIAKGAVRYRLKSGITSWGAVIPLYQSRRSAGSPRPRYQRMLMLSIAPSRRSRSDSYTTPGEWKRTLFQWSKGGVMHTGVFLVLWPL